VAGPEEKALAAEIYRELRLAGIVPLPTTDSEAASVLGAIERGILAEPKVG